MSPTKLPKKDASRKSVKHAGGRDKVSIVDYAFLNSHYAFLKFWCIYQTEKNNKTCLIMDDFDLELKSITHIPASARSADDEA